MLFEIDWRPVEFQFEIEFFTLEFHEETKRSNPDEELHEEGETQQRISSGDQPNEETQMKNEETQMKNYTN